MPDLHKYPFSVWLQHDYETVEECDIHYAQDGRTASCWVSEAFLQHADSVLWESHGMGHPSKVRVMTECAHVKTRRHRATAGLRPIASDACIRPRTSMERTKLRFHHDDEEGVTTPLNGRILTIKVEVIIPKENKIMSLVSGTLPVNQTACAERRHLSNNDRMSTSSKRFSPHPYRSSRRVISLSEPAAIEPLAVPPSGDPPVLLTFYFRSQPNPACPGMPLLSRTCSLPELIQLPIERRSLSPKSDSISDVSETATMVNAEQPVYSIPETVRDKIIPVSDALLRPAKIVLDPSTREKMSGNVEKDPVGAVQLITRDVAVQTDPARPGEPFVSQPLDRLTTTPPVKFACCNGEEVAQLLNKVEQNLLETHQVLLSLRTMMSEKNSVCSPRALLI